MAKKKAYKQLDPAHEYYKFKKIYDSGGYQAYVDEYGNGKEEKAKKSERNTLVRSALTGKSAFMNDLSDMAPSKTANTETPKISMKSNNATSLDRNSIFKPYAFKDIPKKDDSQFKVYEARTDTTKPLSIGNKIEAFLSSGNIPSNLDKPKTVYQYKTRRHEMTDNVPDTYDNTVSKFNVIGESGNNYYYIDKDTGRVNYIRKEDVSDTLPSAETVKSNYAKNQTEIMKQQANRSPFQKYGDRFRENVQSASIGQGARSQVDTGNPVANFAADLTGGIMGLATPVGGGTSLLGVSNKVGQAVTNKLLPKLEGQTLKRTLGRGAIEGSATMPLISGYESVSQELSPEEAAKKMATDMLFGATIGTGASSLKPLYNVARNKINPLREVIQNEKSINRIGEEISNKYFGASKSLPTVRQSTLPALTQSAKGISESVPEQSIKELPNNKIVLKQQSAKGNLKATISEQQPRSLKVKEQPKYNLPDDEASLAKLHDNMLEQQSKGIKIDLQLFGAIQKKLKEMRFASNSIMKSNVIPEEMKAKIASNMPKYEPITNKETWAKATDEVKANYDDAFNKWKSTNEVKTADDTALGQALMVDAIKKGDTKTANEIAYELSERLTKAGQTVQAASILQRLTPDGMLTYINRNLQRASKDLGLKGADKLKLTDNEAKDIVDRMNRLREMADGRAKDIEFANIQKIVSSKIPSTFREKIKALQRVNLLFNPKTMIRNVGGNVIFTGLNNAKDITRAGIDKTISKAFKTERTALLPSIKTQAEGFKQGLRNTVEDFKLGIDTSKNTTQFELNPQRATSPFDYKGKNPFLKGVNNAYKKADEWTRLGLRMGDSPFYQAAYDDVLRQQMKIKGAKEATPEMKAFAEDVAKERTFQNTSSFSKFFDKMRDGLNTLGIKGFGLGDIVLPFTKTPANILRAGVEYSPINLIKVTSNAIKFAKDKSVINQYKLVDSLAKTLTGSGLIAAGAWLAHNGIITGQAPKDYDAEAFQREQGILPYAIKSGSKYISFDWAQPAAIPIAMGADIYTNLKRSKNPQDAIVEGTKGGASTLFSQSMVQGLQRLFLSYNTDSASLLDNLENSGYSAALQLLPFNALTRQTAEVMDTNKRSSYDDTTLETKLINQAKNALPIARQTLPKKYKTTGDNDTSRNIIDTFFNLSNVGSPSLDNARKEILRLYNESGEKVQFPRIADKTITPEKEDKITFKEITLNGNQRSEYQKRLGLETMNAFKAKINDPKYKRKTDSEKAKELQKVITETNSKVKKQLIKDLSLPKIKK